MLKYSIEDIYMTLCGEMEDDHAVPGVPNAFAEGSQCQRLYEEMSAAYARLRDRLSVIDEDEDIEIIINAFMDMQNILCEKMFFLGACMGK